jgi:IMP dehydrogenase
MALIPKRAHGVAVVVEDNKPVGIISPAEIEGVDRFTQVQEVMTGDLTAVGTDATPAEVFDRLSARHQKVALVIDDDASLVGLMTSKGALRSSLYVPALDPSGQLMVGTAIGINGDIADRARRLATRNG